MWKNKGLMNKESIRSARKDNTGVETIHSYIRPHSFIPLGIGAAVFLPYCILAILLAFHGAKDLNNLFFDSDTLFYLRAFAFGEGAPGGWGGRSIVHPNVANFVHPIVAAAELLPRLAGKDNLRRLFEIVGFRRSASDPELWMKLALAFLVAPLAAAFRTSFLFLGLTTAGLDVGKALLVSALSVLSFCEDELDPHFGRSDH